MQREAPNADENNVGPLARGWQRLKALPHNFEAKIKETWKEAKKIGQDDPRRIVHCLKVGLAITLVSLIFYFHPLYEGFGVSAMWAVLTVIVVFEFYVGTTLGRGLNRMVATICGATLGVGAHWIANQSGELGEPVLIATFVFLMTIVVTFVRFFPKMKARYDYGLMIFILTFCLVSVSGYRDDEVIKMALRRIVTIIIGSSTSVLVCILIYPAWIGEELHNQIATNLEKLGNFLKGFGNEYFKLNEGGEGSKSNESFLEGFNSVLTSKSSEETMASANLAMWEPRHGRFRFRHPWKQYLKVGSLARKCAFKIQALSSYLDSEIPEEFRSKFQESCTTISSQTGEALNELALAMRTTTRPSSAVQHIANAKEAAETLETILKANAWKGSDLLKLLPAATVASLLLELVTCTDKVIESVNELAKLAYFKRKEAVSPLELQRSLRRSIARPDAGNDVQNHVITVGE